MLISTNPRLRRLDVVVNSFNSGITNTPKEFSRTPEMSFSKISSKPGMFFEKTEGTVSFKQLKGLTNTHCSGKLSKKMDMVSSDMQFIDFAFLPVSNLPDKELTIHSESIKLEGVSCVFNFPDKMEGILSKAMLSGFQIHFSSPEHSYNYVHQFISGGLVSRPSDSNHLTELNLMEHGDSSPNLKVRVSSPLM